MIQNDEQLSIITALWGDPDGRSANLLGNIPLPRLNRLKLYNVSAENIRAGDSRLANNRLSVPDVFPAAVPLDPFQPVKDAFPAESAGRIIQLVVVPPAEDSSPNPPPYESPETPTNDSLTFSNPTRSAILVKNGVPDDQVRSWEGLAQAFIPTLPRTPGADAANHGAPIHRRDDSIESLNEKLGYFGRHSDEYRPVSNSDERGDIRREASFGGSQRSSPYTGSRRAAVGLGLADVTGADFHSDADSNINEDRPPATYVQDTDSVVAERSSTARTARTKDYVTVTDGPRRKFLLGSPRRKICCAIFILLLIILTVGLAVGLSKRSQDPPSPDPNDPKTANPPNSPFNPPNSSPTNSPTTGSNGSSNNPANGSGTNSPNNPATANLPTVTSSLKGITLSGSSDASIRDIALDLNSGTLFASYGNNVQEWNVNSWSSVLHEAESGANNDGSVVGNVAVEETVVISVGVDGTIRAWDIGKAGAPTKYSWKATEGGANRVCVAARGTLSHPVFGNSTGLWRGLDSGTTSMNGDSTIGAPRFEVKTYLGSTIRLYALGGSASDGSCFLESWEFASKPATTGTLRSNVTIPAQNGITSASSKVFDVSSDGKFAVIAFNPGPVIQIDVGNGIRIGQFDGASPTGAIAISPDGQFLFTENGGSVIQWAVANRTATRKFAGHKGNVLGISVSGDGKYLYSADASSIQQWTL
ncbi:hypothetical protein HDV00_002216 [Rhizophlyctis rosea]|nr:hypothetical protein HDV00_002216 [Rhizophlyctis rosea]